MMTTRPELGFERLLSAIAQDLIDAPDEEVLAIVNELGIRPGMKGSIAFFGVTVVARRKNRYKQSDLQTKESSTAAGTTRGRRRPKGDVPSST